MTYHLLENCVFNAFNQGFNTFSVDSLLFVQPTAQRNPFLVFGVANYGLAAVSLDTCLDWSFMPLEGLMIQTFKVLKLSSDDKDTLHVSTDKIGLREFDIKYDKEDLTSQIVFEEREERSLVNLRNEVITQVVALEGGFALTCESNDENGKNVARLIFQDSMNNIDSSALAVIMLDEFGSCDHLDEARMNVEQTENYKHRYMNVSMICGFQHLVWSVDLAPKIHLEYLNSTAVGARSSIELRKHELTQLVHVTASNGISSS